MGQTESTLSSYSNLAQQAIINAEQNNIIEYSALGDHKENYMVIGPKLSDNNYIYRPSAIAYDNKGNLYIANDSINSHVMVLSPNRKIIRRIDISVAFKRMIITSNDTIVGATDKAVYTISANLFTPDNSEENLNSQSELLIKCDMPVLTILLDEKVLLTNKGRLYEVDTYTCGVATDNDNNIYVLGRSKPFQYNDYITIVRVFDIEGKWIRTIRLPDMLIAENLSINSHNFLVIHYHPNKIYIVDPDNASKPQLKFDLSKIINHINGIVIDGKDNIIVFESDGSNIVLHQYSPTGEYMGLIGAMTETNISPLSSITIDPKGHIAVSSYLNSQIIIFNPF